MGEHEHIQIKILLTSIIRCFLFASSLNMNFPKRSANALTGRTHCYKLPNEHVNSGTAKKIATQLSTEKKTTLLAQDTVNTNSIEYK